MGEKMSLADVFSGKKVLLHAPVDVYETIRFTHYIPVISKFATDVSLMLKENNGLAELIEAAFPNVNVFSPEESPPFIHDLELSLEKVPALFLNENQLIPVGYLRPPADKLAKFKKLMENTGMINIGLALYGSSENALINSATIANNITMDQLHNTQFFFIPADPAQNVSKPPFSNFNDTTGLVQNYCELAGLLASLDIIISFENDVAHLAAAMGKPVWLLVPNSARINKLNSWDAFSNVSIYRQPASGDWHEVIQNIALFRFIQPESPSFEPFSTKDMTLERPAALPFPTIYFENTSQLIHVLDAKLAVFTSVSIETTTVCNLKCSYCPHSTDAAKPPAYMPDEMFFRIIDSLYDYAPSYSGTIAPSMYGEPLLDKRIETFIRYAKQRFPQSRIELFTNGDFLTTERFFSLQEAGVDHYNISQHTPTRSQALSDTLSTVQRELAEELPITIIKMLERNKFNRGGLVEVEGLPPELCVRQSYCAAAYQNLSFDYKGDAILCCNDYQAKHVFGNIVSQSVGEIWEDRSYRRARNMLMLGFLPFPICRVCLSH